MPFPDPNRPMAPRSSPYCRGCPVEDKIQRHFRGRDYILFLVLCLPGFLLGGWGVLQGGGGWLVLWLGLILAYFGAVEVRVLCSHCPHYAEPGRLLACWANRGMPKPWKHRPGPMSIWEKIVFLGGIAAVWGYPLVFLAGRERWLGLVLYVVCAAGFLFALKVL